MSLSFPVLYDRIFCFKLFRGWIARIFSKIPVRQRKSRLLASLVFMSHIEQRGE